MNLSKRARELPVKPLQHSAKRRCRGRPRVEWTVSRQRRLLRLYLCTPESDLPLRQILALLSDKSFAPKERQTQVLLQSLLSKSYKHRRPNNRACMKNRVNYLRSTRVRSPLKPLASHATSTRPSVFNTSTTGLAPPPPNEKSSLSTIVEVPGQDLRLPIDTWLPLQGTNTLHIASAVEYEARVGRQTQQGISVDGVDALTDTGMCLDVAPIGESHYTERKRKERFSLLMKALPGQRTPSFLADVASLLSGLSLRSSLQSFTSRSSQTSLRSSSIKGAASPKADVPLHRSQLFQSRASVQDQTYIPPRARNYLPQLEKQSDDSESDNKALTASCCSRRNRLIDFRKCIHQRLSHVIQQGVKASHRIDSLAITEEEANARDSIGNTLLHTAARWGASTQLILRILYETRIDNFANNRNETFLHVWDPAPNDSLPTFIALLNGLRTRRFDFLRLDSSGRPFVNRLVLKENFSWNALVALFKFVDWEVAESWVDHVPQTGGSLALCVQEKLGQENSRSLGLALHAQYFMDKRVLTGTFNIVTDLLHGPYKRLGCRTVGRGGSLLHGMIATLNRDFRWTIKRWERGGSDHDSPECTTTFQFDTALNRILETEIDVNDRELYTGRTPLMTLLTEFGCGIPEIESSTLLREKLQESCVSTLLHHGASLELCDHYGNTPVHYAAVLGLIPALKIFIQHKANLRSKNIYGITPQDMVAHSMKAERDSGNRRGVEMVARLMEVMTILIE